jgi:hypothetical protein
MKINVALKTIILPFYMYVRKRNIRLERHAARMAEERKLKIPPHLLAEVWLSKCLRSIVEVHVL